MATSRRLRLAVLALGLIAAGCGSSASSSSSGRTHTTSAGAGTAAAWLHASPAPASWPAINIPSGGRMVYPPGWHSVRGDVGTATAALTSSSGKFVGYLNLTPRQGKESLANFPTFRVDHNHDEGDRQIRRLAAATNLTFPTGRGSCVKDQYRTSSGGHYVEVACLVSGQHTTAVIVGAAPPAAWSQTGGEISRAILGVGA